MDEIPEGFAKIVKDFLNDINTSYPEFNDQIKVNVEMVENDLSTMYKFCKDLYPERFFDILYQNEDIFCDKEKNVTFLPNIDFKNIWSDEISDQTKKIIWKYLQLILFTVVGDADNSKMFGETSKLFEAIDEDSLKKKLEETINEMGNIFDLSNNPMNFENFQDMSGVNMGDLPNADDLHNHISGLMDGKLGKLANDIAEETAKELDLDLENTSDISDIFQRLFKNPGKLINMVKKVGNKIEQKIKSGEIKESELMEEAQEMMKKMNTMPGMNNFQKMFGSMGMPGMGGGGKKMNMGHFNNMMQNNIKISKQKERMLEKLRKRKEAEKGNENKNFVHSTFSDNTKVEKSTRAKKKKKKKRKKKKKKVEEEEEKGGK
jgi:hypothetical protein